MSKYAAYCLAMAAVANAIVGPNLPWGGTVDVAGQDCKIGWTLDTTGQWTNMSIELMTGDNQNFVHLAWVAHGLDGTTGDGSYTWTCPTVDPASKIYFYQFVNPGQQNTYTTRFTIAAADGSTVDPPNATQPNGDAIPWGTGRIVSGGDGTSSGGNSNSTTGGGSSNSSTGSGSSSSSVPSSNSNISATSADSDSTTDATTSADPTSAASSTTRISNTRSTGATSSSGVSSAIGGNANGNNNNTGAASSLNVKGNMAAGLGMVLALVAGTLMA